MFTEINKLWGTEEIDETKINDYILNIYLSGDIRTVMLANFFNLNSHIDMKTKVKVIRDFLSKKGIKGITYPKSETPIRTEELEDVANKYNISLDIAKDYIQIIRILENE